MSVLVRWDRRNVLRRVRQCKRPSLLIDEGCRVVNMGFPLNQGGVKVDVDSLRNHGRQTVQNPRLTATDRPLYSLTPYL